MTISYADIVFNDEDIELSLNELNTPTSLSMEAQRSIAAYALLTSALAMAIVDEADYVSALQSIEGFPEDEEQQQFLHDFGHALVQDLKNEFGSSCPAADNFSRRTDELLNSTFA